MILQFKVENDVKHNKPLAQPFKVSVASGHIGLNQMCYTVCMKVLRGASCIRRSIVLVLRVVGGARVTEV